MQFMRQSAAARQPFTISRQSPISNMWRSRRIELRPVDIIRQFARPDFVHRAFPYLSADELSFLRTGCTEHELLAHLDGNEPDQP